MSVTAEDLNDLRRRVLADEDYTREELTVAIKSLTADRLQNVEKPKKKTSRGPKTPPPKLDDLL